MRDWLDRTMSTVAKRRSFVKWGSAAVASTALPLKVLANTTGQQEQVFASDENTSNKKTTWSACMVNCGSRCALQVHTQNGVITSIESDNRGDDKEFGQHQIRACLRGRAIKGRVYNPDRLKYPMKRVGQRCEARFERITWDEALDLMADKLKYAIKEYGNDAS